MWEFIIIIMVLNLLKQHWKIFLLFLAHRYNTGSWNPSLWKAKTYLSHSQYLVCTWPGDGRSQGISSHGIAVSNLGFGFAGGKPPLHLKSRGDFSNGRGIFFLRKLDTEIPTIFTNHSPNSISRRFSRKLQPCPFPLPFWHEFRICGGCCLQSRCWRRCFRAVNCDNGRCTRLSSRWCRSGLEKRSNWSGTNPPLRWFLCHFGYCCLHRLVPGCDSTRYCHHLAVTIGCPSERFLINIHEWAARWASSRSIFRPCASQTASFSSVGFTMSNTSQWWEVRIHRSTPRSARVRP